MVDLDLGLVGTKFLIESAVVAVDGDFSASIVVSCWRWFGNRNLVIFDLGLVEHWNF